MEIARNLEALLPRRPKKRAQIAGKGRKPGKTVKVHEDDGATKKRNGKEATRRKRIEETEGSDLDEGEEEKRVRERQARIDYFKKLDRYEVQREDVYVV